MGKNFIANRRTYEIRRIAFKVPSGNLSSSGCGSHIAMIELTNWSPRTTSAHDATAPTIAFNAEGDTSHFCKSDARRI
jgi:hypothetical protein